MNYLGYITVEGGNKKKFAPFHKETNRLDNFYFSVLYMYSNKIL